MPQSSLKRSFFSPFVWLNWREMESSKYAILKLKYFRGSQCDEVTKKIQDSSVLRRLLSVKVSVDAIIC